MRGQNAVLAPIYLKMLKVKSIDLNKEISERS